MKKILSFIAEYFRTTDRWMLLLWLTASAASVLFLFGIHSSGLMNSEGRVVSMQIAASSAGFLAAIFLSLFDYRAILKFWKLYLPVCVLLVLLTFFYGIVRGGDRAWLPVSMGSISFTIQPTEFLKISMIMTFSLHINHVKEHMNRFSSMLLLLLHGASYILLVQIQGDSGTALIFVLIFLIMIFFAGIAWRYIMLAALMLVPGAVILWFKVMTLDQQLRFLTVYTSSLDPKTYEQYIYQQQRGLFALGVGGIQGTGIFSGKHIDVPEIYNDFIFAFIGQSTGLIGCLGIMALLLIISLKLLYNSSLAINDTGRLICVGAFAMIVAQIVINLGMVLKLLPVIGVTLPLFSSGGSSVFSLYLMLGLVLSVYRHSSKGLFYSKP